MSSFFSFPVNLFLGFGILVLLWVVESEWGQHRIVRRLRSAAVACWLLGITVVWSIIGGLVPPQWAVDGSLWQALGFGFFPSSWGFRLLIGCLLAHLSLVIIHRFRLRQYRRDASFLLLHTGLWLVLVAGSIGTFDRVEGRAVVTSEAECTTMFLRDGRILPLGYGIHLDAFDVERSPADGSVVQYTATIVVDSVGKHDISVNNPFGIRWYEDLYLTGFDHRHDVERLPVAIIMVVREPWKPVTMAGILLLAAGMLSYAFRRSSRISRQSPHHPYP